MIFSNLFLSGFLRFYAGKTFFAPTKTERIFRRKSAFENLTLQAKKIIRKMRVMLAEKHLDELRNFAEKLADTAREIVAGYHAKFHTEIEIKNDGSPVTVADKECERVLRAMIHDAFPQHGIIGEEFGNENTDAEFVWSLDPIDGTKSFVSRVSLYGILFGLLHEGKPLIGVIDQPITRERIIGDGRDTRYNGVPVRVSDTPSVDKALLLTTDFIDCETKHPNENWNALLHRARLFRTWGDCYGYMLVANGRADIMADPELSPWDLYPLLPILRGAGAEVTDWNGNDPLHAKSILAANPRLHAEALAILNTPPNP